MNRPTTFRELGQKLAAWLRGHAVSPKSLDAKAHFEELRRSEALLAEAEEIGHLGCWEHNLVTGADVWSANLCRMLGVDPAKTTLSEELFWEILHPDDREVVQTAIEGGMKYAQEYEYQSRFILPGGRERTFYTWGKPILGPDNQVIKRMGMTQDISMRVEAERALMESEERYRDLVESSHDLICTHDLRGRVLSMNELPARLLGYRPEELIGLSIPDHLSRPATDKFAEYIERIQRDGFANGTMVLMTKSGEKRIWEYQNTLRTQGVPAPVVRGMAHDVTEKFKAQKALCESNARLQALVNSIDQIAFEFDVDGTFLDIWTTNENLLYRPREQLLGRRISDVISEEFAPVCQEIFKRVLETGKGEDLEYSLSVMDGERWFLGRITPVTAPDGAYKSICMLARDITVRKQTEKSLSLFRALIDRSNDGIEVVDPMTLRFLDVNQKTCSNLGYSREELLLMSVYDISPSLDSATYAKAIEVLKRSGSFIRESIHRRKDGSRFPVEININLVQLDKCYIVTVTRDITERKRTRAALHESEARFRLATQAGKMYAFEWDATTDVVVRSAECADVLGEGVPTRATLRELLDAVYPEDLQGYNLNLLTPANPDANVKYRVVRRDGSIIWVQNTARAFFDEQGKMLRIIGMVADITARKRAEDALQEKEVTIRSLFHIAQTLTQTLELDAILEHLNYESMMLIGAEGSSAGLLNEQEFRCACSFDRTGLKKEGIAWPSDTGLLGWVITNKRTYLTNDATRDPLIPPESDNPLGLRNVLCVPVLGNQGEVIAFFALHNRTGGDFRPSDVETVEGISTVASIAIQNALAYQRTCRAEENLRTLSTQLINMQDEDRRLIALNLHEGLAQNLAALRLTLGHLKRKTARNKNGATSIIEESLKLNETLIEDVRDLSYRLHPPHLEEVGLTLAIAAYARRFSENSGIQVLVTADLPEDIFRFPHAYEIAIFRIMQECLSNVYNHSHSNMATIRVSFQDEHLILEIADRGWGIDAVPKAPTVSSNAPGIGIASMRERVKQMRGTFFIQSVAGEGVTVRVDLPVGTDVSREARN